MEKERMLKGLHARSEDVELLMGQTPSWIFRWGMMLIAFIVLGLLAASWFMPWPETLVLRGRLEAVAADSCWYFHSHVELPGRKALKSGMAAHITLDVLDDQQSPIPGIVAPLPLCRDSTGLYPVVITVQAPCRPHSSDCNTLAHLPLNPVPQQLDATATIILHNSRLLQRLFRP